MKRRRFNMCIKTKYEIVMLGCGYGKTFEEAYEDFNKGYLARGNKYYPIEEICSPFNEKYNNNL